MNRDTPRGRERLRCLLEADGSFKGRNVPGVSSDMLESTG